jgi:hypothetical protein
VIFPTFEKLFKIYKNTDMQLCIDHLISWLNDKLMSKRCKLTTKLEKITIWSVQSAHKQCSQGCKGIKWTVWFRFFQKDQIWPRCCPYHTFPIFDGRQGRHPPGPSYWRNPIWPPLELKVDLSRSTKKARIMKYTTF